MDTLFLILPVIFIILAGVLAALGMRSRKRAAEVQSWPTVHGTIVSSTMKENVSTDDDGATSVTYQPVIEYRYTIKNIDYSSRQYQLGSVGMSYDQKRAGAILARYPANQPVQVHFNPQKPSEAVLELGSASAMLFFILAGVFGLVGLIFLVVGMLI